MYPYCTQNAGSTCRINGMTFIFMSVFHKMANTDHSKQLQLCLTREVARLSESEMYKNKLSSLA